MFDVQEYEKRKKIIANKKEQLARDEGKLESLQERLQTEFNCSVEEAPIKREELLTKQQKISLELDKIEKELDKYDWSV